MPHYYENSRMRIQIILNLYQYKIRYNSSQIMFSAKSTTPISRDSNKKLVKLVHHLLTKDESVNFRKPVAHKALGLDDYKLIVKKPIDLNLIRRQNNEGKYKFVEEVLDQIQLCWNNCKVYNCTDSDIYKECLIMEEEFDKIGIELLPEFWVGIDRESLNKAQRERKLIQEKNKIMQISNAAKNLNPKREKQIIEAEQAPKTKKIIKNPAPAAIQKLQQLQKKTVQQDQIKKQVFEGIKIDKIIEEPKQAQNPQMDDNQMQIEDPNEPPIEPILVNLMQSPSRQQLLQLSKTVMDLMSSSEFSLIQKVLQVLHTNEKEHMHISKSGIMTFNMQKIHISTYYRIKKVLGLPNQSIQLIE